MADRGWSDAELVARCVRCELELPARDAPLDGCPKCRAADLGSNMALSVPAAPGMALTAEDTTGIWRFAPRLPIVPEQHRVTLGEGKTPLLELPQSARIPERAELWVKDEGLNPTLSYKDRFMAAAISRAKYHGAKIVAASSTGNGGGSAAAYAARAELGCVVFATADIPDPQRRSIEAVGGEVVALPGTSARWDLLGATVSEWGWYPLTSFADPPNGSSLFGISGYKTIAFEIYEELEDAPPDWVVVPLSMGDGLFGIWHGFVELRDLGLLDRLPRMVSVEPAQAAPLATSLAAGAEHIEPLRAGPSVAYNVGSSGSSEQAAAAIRASGGIALAMPESEILPLKAEFASMCGIYAEASSVLALWGARQALRSGERAVAVVTSSGLKDPDPAWQPAKRLETIQPTLRGLMQALPSELVPT